MGSLMRRGGTNSETSCMSIPPDCEEFTLHQAWQAGVLKDMDIMGAVHPVNTQVHEGNLVVHDSLENHRLKVCPAVIGMVSVMWWVA